MNVIYQYKCRKGTSGGELLGLSRVLPPGVSQVGMTNPKNLTTSPPREGVKHVILIHHPTFTNTFLECLLTFMPELTRKSRQEPRRLCFINSHLASILRRDSLIWARELLGKRVEQQYLTF